MDVGDRRKRDALAGAVEQLAAARAAQAGLERYIARALHWGASWVGAVLGVSRQSAHERYRCLRYDPARGHAWHEPPLPM